MPEPLPISPEELNQLLKDPKALIRRMVLSFVLERPRPVRVGQPVPKKPKDG